MDNNGALLADNCEDPSGVLHCQLLLATSRGGDVVLLTHRFVSRLSTSQF
jgi:hypothetical protein